MTLKKRLFSSPAAFLRTLEQHEASLRNAKKRKAVSKPTRGVLQRQIDRVDEDYSVDDEADEATHEALDAASLLFREPSPEELSLLKEMKAWAERATSQLDAKTKGLIRWLQRAHPAGRQVVRRAGHHLHRVPGHPELAARRPRRRGAHRGRPAPDDVRRDGLEGPGADQGGVPDRPEAEPRPHPAGDRRRLRGHRPPEPLLPA